MSEAPGEQAVARRKIRVLFVAEAVTLAHVARPVALARGLDPDRFEVVLASDPRYQALLGDLPFPTRPIPSISSAQFLDALDKGRPLYDAATLRSYVREDLDLLRETAPDVVIGDFRLSLSVSARVARVPYFGIINAYWSPYARQRFPMPELPITRWLGVAAPWVLFRLVRPLAFALHTRPLNRVRREYSLPDLGFDLRRTYADADHVLYADVPEIIPTYDRPAHHHYLGPVLWSPEVSLPSWWKDLSRDRPAIYVTLGSSGRADLLASVLEALRNLPVVVLVATLGRELPAPPPPNALLTAYLPGIEAAARARLVVCNGGSPTVQQALSVGTPVLGLPCNMDQHLNMEALERCGAGIRIRSEHARKRAIHAQAAQILENTSYSEAAHRLADTFTHYDPGWLLQDLITRTAEESGGPHHGGPP